MSRISIDPQTLRVSRLDDAESIVQPEAILRQALARALDDARAAVAVEEREASLRAERRTNLATIARAQQAPQPYRLASGEQTRIRAPKAPQVKVRPKAPKVQPKPTRAQSTGNPFYSVVDLYGWLLNGMFKRSD